MEAKTSAALEKARKTVDFFNSASLAEVVQKARYEEEGRNPCLSEH